MGTAVTLSSTKIGPRAISQCQIPVATVNLGLAAPFAILASTAMTDAGGSQINGYMGTTGTATLPVYPPYAEGTPGINGILHNNDVTANTARRSAIAAWSDILGRCDCAMDLGSIVELGGRTLTPGLYTSTSSFHSECSRALYSTFPNPGLPACQNSTQFINFDLTFLAPFAVTSGILTLDAGSKTDAIFIFRTSGALITTGASKVILTGGASCSNIYWSVGTAAHFDSGTTIEGTIFAGTTITYAAHCIHHGRYNSNPISSSLSALSPSLNQSGTFETA